MRHVIVDTGLSRMITDINFELITCVSHAWINCDMIDLIHVERHDDLGITTWTHDIINMNTNKNTKF